MESRVPALRAAERPVSVEVGQAPSEERRLPPNACVVAVGPLRGPWLCDAFPDALVRKSRFDSLPVGVEHLRLESRAVVDKLPGLEYRHGPSLVRDAVSGILSAGAESVDVLFGRVVGGKPWDFDDERVFRVLDGYLGEMAGTMLLFPDIAGPLPRTPNERVDQDARYERLVSTLAQYGPQWSERYQLALMDDPKLPEPLMRRLLGRLLGNDVTVCRWSGTHAALSAHGWRSAGAAIVGLLTGSHRALLGMVGQVATLGEARRAPSRRHDLLSRTDPVRVTHDWEEYFLDLEIDPGLRAAKVCSEPTFRRPMGAWPFSALRMVKAVHQRLVEAGSRFVFEPADPRSAMAFGSALQHSLRPFVDAGLLVGPDAAGGEPLVVASIDIHPDGARALVADVMSNLRPWSRKVAVRVALRPNESPSLEVL